MKLILTSTLMLLLLTVPAFSELTPADIDKIRLIVKEEVEQAVTASEARLRKEIEAQQEQLEALQRQMETRPQEHIVGPSA